jgi:diaminopimelate decarboxylase
LKKLKVKCNGVQINIDNLSILEQFGAKHQMFLYVSVSTHVMAGGNTNISVGHIDKFGISIHQLPHLVRIVENTK